MQDITIRQATAADAALILQFVTELAIFEKAESAVTATVEDIERTMFTADSTSHALICCRGDEAIGFAVYFFNYSTWLAKSGIFLEDLYITPEFRGQGAGKRMMRHLAQIAVENNCGRFEWNVLDWNKGAIDVYESIGAKPLNEWVTYRLDADALQAFASD